MDSPRPARDEDLRSSLYEDLRRLADRHMQGQRRDHLLQPTALVHEAYLKVAGATDRPERSRTHFLSLASQVMRQVLVDHERIRRADKRGASRERVTLSGIGLTDGRAEIEILSLHAALEDLARLSPQNSRLVELRFFGGLTESEVAEELGVSRASVTRQWRFVRAWLARRLGEGEDGAP